MSAGAANFDALARIYAALERLALGRSLERARFQFLDRLRDRKSILVLGEGDGRCLARVTRLAPQATIHCVDASAAMLATAARRLAEEDRSRVRFTQADARSLPLPTASYDAIITLFFLDCFTPAECAALVSKLTAAATVDCVWLYSDFALPPNGWRRWRARVWLGGLYFFFQSVTHISARALPDVATLLRARSWRQTAHMEREAGLLHSDVWSRS